MDTPEVMTTEQVADYLQVRPRTVERWCYTGDGPTFVKVGRHRRFRRADVDAWLEEHSRQSSGPGLRQSL